MKYRILAILLIASITACKKDTLVNIEEATNAQSIAPNGFNFATTKTVKIRVRLLSNNGEPLANIPVTFHNPKDDKQLLKSLTNSNGYIDANLNIAGYIEQLIVKPHFIGINNEVTGFFTNNTLDLVIGGKKGVEGNVILASTKNTQSAGKQTQSVGFQNTAFSYLGTYDVNGRPNYLAAQSGTVSSNLLNHINSSIPDAIDVRTSHPAYLTETAKQTLDIVKTGEVFITFVSEGAGLTNAIGYYTYPTNTPPSNASDITDIKYIFPNSSAFGSSGGLLSGDRVSLGTYNAGISIGIVLFSNGWDSNNKAVTSGVTKFYTNKSANPESTNSLKKHIVLLNFAQEDLFVIGIEDLNRESEPLCDHDFNDVVLYADSYPKDAISKLGVPSLDTPKDTDGDGVTDEYDEFPTDNKKAYTNYFPAKNSWGTLAFEDNWPLKGDYDMNDLVINYRYTYITNAANNVVEMNADYKVLTSLAYYHNGFGVELPISSSAVDCTNGYIKEKNYIKLNANGTEAGQDKAVIIPFDDQKLIYNAASGWSEQVSMNIKFTTPQAMSILSNAPYNPFIISDGRRSHEIHLPGNTPTNLADKALFGYQDDLSKPTTGKYYIGTNNWPWALQFTEPFNPPAEGVAIDQVYSRFGAWASSGGSSFTDWYKNLGK